MPVYKVTRAKWTGGVAYVVECLLCMSEALSSNFSPTKKIKKAKAIIDNYSIKA
jgi:hypothetical protein